MVSCGKSFAVIAQGFKDPTFKSGIRGAITLFNTRRRLIISGGIRKKMSRMPQNLNGAAKETVREFINSFDTVFTDCDGVLWLGNEVVEKSDASIKRLRELGKNVFYITNNSTKTREEFIAKSEKLGFEANWDNFICTSYLAAEYLSSLKFDKKVYVIGSEGVMKELDRFGIKHTESGPDVLETNLESYIKEKLSKDEEVGAVLIGFDEHFSYPKVLRAASYLKNPDCLFIATNTDENITLDDILLPGTGSLVKCVETVVGRKAYVIGKPNDYIKEAVKKNYVINNPRTLMIGDRCNTDILFGKRCGFQTLLVLSGVTSAEEMKKFASSPDPAEQDLVPDYYINKLGDLLDFMP